MGSLLVITGPPGAGKSTVAAKLAGQADRSVLVEGDRFFGFLAAGAVPPWLPESRQQNTVVTEAAGLATGRFASDYDTIYEGIVGPWLLPTFAAATGLSELGYVVLLPPAATCAQRVRSRAAHSFDDVSATNRMHAEFSAASIDGRHVVVNDIDDAQETARQIDRAWRSGELSYAIERGL